MAQKNLVGRHSLVLRYRMLITAENIAFLVRHRHQHGAIEQLKPKSLSFATHDLPNSAGTVDRCMVALCLYSKGKTKTIVRYVCRTEGSRLGDLQKAVDVKVGEVFRELGIV